MVILCSFCLRPYQDKVSRILCSLLFLLWAGSAVSQVENSQQAPVVAKVEPPTWWVNLTPDLIVMLTGSNLLGGTVSCDLPGIAVDSTESGTSGEYLFVWLKFGASLKPDKAVFHVTTAQGQTSFDLPLSERTLTLGRNQGLNSDDVIYLIMPDRFANGDPRHFTSAEFRANKANLRTYHGGDLIGIRQHLPYLKELGITTIWLTPIVKNGDPTDYHGYGAVDLYDVDPHLGTVKDYQDLVAAAHEENMKVFFDVVPNHVGPFNPWVRNPPRPDWFHGTASNHLACISPLSNSFYGLPKHRKPPVDLFESLVDPHTPSQLRKNITEGWFPGLYKDLPLPDMNTENPTVVKFLIQNSIWWAENSGLDGYRIDTYPYVAREFWAQWNAALLQIYPHLSTIGEVFHSDPTVTSFFVGGRRGSDDIDTQLTTVFDYPTYFTLRDVLLAHRPVGKILNVLRQDSLYPHPELLVTFFGNHDTPRFAGMPRATLTKLKLAFGLVATLRGVPELYYGDEIGMQGGGDPDNRRDFPGGWRDDPRNAFTSEGRSKEQEELSQFVKTLLNLRREHAALRGGRLWHLAADDSSYIFLRESGPDKLVVAFSNAAMKKSVKVSLRDTPAENSATEPSMLFGDVRVRLVGDELRLTMPARSLSIIKLN